jgi:hypothetical protein
MGDPTPYAKISDMTQAIHLPLDLPAQSPVSLPQGTGAVERAIVALLLTASAHTDSVVQKSS